jgi:tRNA(Ile)-lysidine synthase
VTARLDPAVAAVRHAVRRALADLDPARRVLVACSGGADSMARAAGAAFEGGRAGWQGGAVVVDHGLQPDSAAVSAAVADRLRGLAPYLGLDPVEVHRVRVEPGGGPEAAARRARYRALEEAAVRHRAVVLLGHTLDDQAETVLLGLARGSGVRSIAGMRPVSGPFRRPLLGLSRADTARACAALGVETWQDPANEDPRFLRSRVRHRVLPVLEQELGPGIAEALARTADLARADADLLDGLAAAVLDRAAREQGSSSQGPDPGEVRLAVGLLAAEPAALRHRALRLAALAAGCPAGDLFAVHVRSLDELVVGWHGQRSVDLPGGRTARRDRDELVLAPRPAADPGRRTSPSGSARPAS